MRRPPSPPLRAARIRAVVVVALTIILLAAVAALQGLPDIRDLSFDEPSAPPMPEQTAQPEPTILPVEPSEVSPWVTIIAAVIGILLAAAVAYVVLGFLIAQARRAWRDRPLGRADGVDTVEAEPAAVAATVDLVDAPIVRRGIVGALDAVQERADPSDAIIAAWLGLEEAAESAGQRRGVAETPGEFTVRIVGSRQASGPDVRALLRLYENVRFGGRDADEADRATARRLLIAIEEQWR